MIIKTCSSKVEDTVQKWKEQNETPEWVIAMTSGNPKVNNEPDYKNFKIVENIIDHSKMMDTYTFKYKVYFLDSDMTTYKDLTLSATSLLDATNKFKKLLESMQEISLLWERPRRIEITRVDCTTY